MSVRPAARLEGRAHSVRQEIAFSVSSPLEVVDSIESELYESLPQMRGYVRCTDVRGYAVSIVVLRLWPFSRKRSESRA